jgi:hypothetical protein
MGARGRLLFPLGAFGFAAMAACATLGTSEPEGQNLPTNDVGPFRKLTAAEDLGIAPYVLDGLGARSFEEPSILALDTNPASMDVAIYVDTSATTDAGVTVSIARTRATDGVSFYGTLLDSPHTPEVVLTADAAWEGASVHSPSAIQIGSRVALYYAAAGGIGVAVSNDGVAFLKNPTPVLAPDSSAAWETTVPTAPSVAVFPDQTLHMLYAAGDSIGEATSADGYTWTRVDGDPSTPALDPVLAPSPFAGPVPDDASGLPFDTGQVTDPCLLPRVAASGRLLVRVLYTGYQGPPGATGRASAIGYAARYGDAGALVRNGSPVYSVGKHEAAPALFEWSEGSLLYVSQDSSTTPVYPEIAAGVFPATLTLPTPKTYATSP